MKAEVHQAPEAFMPVTIEITIENRAELENLFVRMAFQEIDSCLADDSGYSVREKKLARDGEQGEDDPFFMALFDLREEQ